MLYVEHYPGPPLSHAIERMWLVSAEVPPFAVERILPDGAIELFFNLGQPHVLVGAGGDRTEYAASWVAGQRTGAITVAMPGDCKLAGVRFRPGGAARFLGLPACELTDRVVELDAVWGRTVDRVRARIAERAACPADVFAILESELRRRAGDRVMEDSPVTRAVVLIAAGGTDVADVARRLGVSSRQLLRRFEREVGVGPKTLQRVLRLQRALALAWDGSTWAEIASCAGYSDQAHMSREFRALTGMTPAAYASARDGWTNEIPVRS